MMMTEDLKMTGYLPSPLKKIKIEMPSLPEIILPKTLPSKSNVERSQSSRFYRPVSSNNGLSSPVHAVLTQKPIIESGPSLKDAIVSKRTMPKLYSRKVKMNDASFKDGVPRLVDLCLKVLCNHIDLIDEVGDLPYFVLKGVLDRCTPVQLMRIESHNPHLIDDTDQLWEGFCKKEFKLFMGDKPAEESWCEYYVRLCQQRDHKLQQLKLKVNEHLVQAESPKRKTKLTCAISKPASRRRGLLAPPSNTVTPASNSNQFCIKQPTMSMASRPSSFNASLQVASAPKRVKTVPPEEPTVVIPSRAEILAKRGLKTLNDPRIFKGQSSSASSVSNPPSSTSNAGIATKMSGNIMSSDWKFSGAKLISIGSDKRPKESPNGSIARNSSSSSTQDLLPQSVASKKIRKSLVGNGISEIKASKTEIPKSSHQLQKLSSKSDHAKMNFMIKEKCCEKSKNAELKPRKRMFDS